MRVRDATTGDLPALCAIYNHEVRHGTATFDTVEATIDERRAWLEDHRARGLPVLVAELEGAVAGWGSLSEWSGRCAYAGASEISVYVGLEHRGRGAGRALVQGLVERGAERADRVLIARIESSNRPSLSLFGSAGFETVGVMHQVGCKFGRILDVVVMERLLAAPPAEARRQPTKRPRRAPRPARSPRRNGR